MGQFMCALTPEQEQAAFERRRRPSWPASFEAAMQDPTLARLIRIDAWRAARIAAKPSQPKQQRPALVLPPYQHSTDFKRLAAGDFED